MHKSFILLNGENNEKIINIIKESLSKNEEDTFSIIDSLDLEDGALITIDKEIYGLGETVHLSGIIPPTGDNSVTISVTMTTIMRLQHQHRSPIWPRSDPYSTHVGNHSTAPCRVPIGA